MTNKKRGELLTFNVSSQIRPEIGVESLRRGNIITWGANNNYPQYLKTLLELSPTHSGIVEKFIKLISGGGFTYEETPQNEAFFQNSDDSESDLNDILIQMASQWETYSSVCLKVYWDARKTGVRRLEVIPIDWIRITTPDDLSQLNVTQIQVCEDWNNRFRYPITIYNKFDPDTEDTIQYYWIGDWEGFYPKPKWISAEADILTEAKIARFHYKAITNGFAMGKIITFVDGVPDDESRKAIIEEFRSNLQSEEKAGTNLFWFADSKDSVPVVSTIQEENLDKKYNDLIDKLEKSILKAHGIVNPILYGIRIQGGLTSGKEILDSLAAEQAINIGPIQKLFTDHINYLAEFSGAGGFEIEPFMITFDEKLDWKSQIEIITNPNLNNTQKRSLLLSGGVDELKVNELLPEETPITPNV